MSVAWTTIVVIALLLPAVLLFVGLSVKDRFPKEIVRTGVVGEVAIAVFVAILFHSCAMGALWLCGVSLEYYILPILHIEFLPDEWWWEIIARRAPYFAGYIVGLSLIGLALGYLLGNTSFFITHKWTRELLATKDALVTAYVMTKTTIKDQTLMYKGEMKEIYFKPEGVISYIGLMNCKKFLMKSTDEGLFSGKQLSLFDYPEGLAPADAWNYLVIDGSNIANVLFDRSPRVLTNPEGEKALDEALQSQVGSAAP